MLGSSFLPQRRLGGFEGRGSRERGSREEGKRFEGRGSREEVRGKRFEIGIGNGQW